MSSLNEFGLHLRQARENRGMSLRQIAGATKISTVALEALERGDFSRLPGGIFSRAFVRAYAVEVGLDPEETVQKYAELSEAIANAASRTPAPAEISDDDRAFLERQRQAGVALKVVAAIIIVAIGGTVGWWVMSHSRRAAVSGATGTPAASPAAPAPTEPVAAPPSSALPPATDPSSAPTAQAAETSRGIVIKLHADEGCWVQITADGRSVLSRNLTAGEDQTIEADREVAVQFGNAGAIVWTINNKPAKALGALGEVKRATITKENVADFLK